MLATEADERTKLTAEQTTLGSPHYMAPEQLDSSKPVDLRADLYALGATAYPLLAGHPPFDKQHLPQIIAKKLSDERPELPAARNDVSAEGLALMNSLLARDLDQRLGSYGVLLSRIDALQVMIAADSATLAWRTATSHSMSTLSAVTDVRTQPARQPIRAGMKVGLGIVAALMVTANS